MAPRSLFLWTAALLATPVVAPSETAEGLSSTRLADGSWLEAGGWDGAHALSRVSIRSARGAGVAALSQPRAWHTATLLPDGNVWFFGGVDAGGPVSSTEIYDALTATFQPLPVAGPAARSRHTATLLTDGTVLIAGGICADGSACLEVERWNPKNGRTEFLAGRLARGRVGHSATLDQDGRVLLWGGRGPDGEPLTGGEIYDPVTQTTHSVDSFPLKGAAESPARVTATLPSDGARDVPAGDTLLAVRFSRPILPESVNAATVRLSRRGAAGVEPVAVRVVPAEGGLLAFATPVEPLQGGSTYVLEVTGAADGTSQLSARVSFTAGDPDFSLEVPVQSQPYRMTIGSETWSNIPVQVTALNGFAGTVQVVASVSPFTTVVISGSGPVTFPAGGPTAQTAWFGFWSQDSALVGQTVPVTFTGTADSLSHTAGTSLSVNTFELTPATASLTVPRKGSASLTFTVTPISGYFGSMYFQAFGLPKGAAAAFNPQTVTINPGAGDATTILTITTKGATSGNYAVTVSPYLYSQQSAVSLKVR